MSNGNPISSVPATPSRSVVRGCVFVTMIMTGEGVEVSKAHAGDEQHPNVVIGGPRPARRRCIFVCACVREREDERRKQRQRQRQAERVFVCFVGSECVSLIFFALSHTR
jgi:hypothetical protein